MTDVIALASERSAQVMGRQVLDRIDTTNLPNFLGPVPAGVTYAVTMQTVFDTTSFGGTVNEGAMALDNRVHDDSRWTINFTSAAAQ